MARNAIEAGSQVFFEYGCKGNPELMLHYGFAIPNNPYTNLDIEFFFKLKGLILMVLTSTIDEDEETIFNTLWCSQRIHWLISN